MHNKKCILGITLLVVGLISSLLFIYKFQNKINNLNNQNLVLSEENKKAKQINSENVAVISNLNVDIRKRDDIIESLPKLEEHMIQQLKTKGFKGDSQVIISDLIKHKGLIPYEGVLGGTMNFDNIYVLTDQWVLASINDGHIDGFMLLKYDLSNGKILWQLMSSYLNNK